MMWFYLYLSLGALLGVTALANRGGKLTHGVFTFLVIAIFWPLIFLIIVVGLFLVRRDEA